MLNELRNRFSPDTPQGRLNLRFLSQPRLQLLREQSQENPWLTGMRALGPVGLALALFGLLVASPLFALSENDAVKTGSAVGWAVVVTLVSAGWALYDRGSSLHSLLEPVSNEQAATLQWLAERYPSQAGLYLRDVRSIRPLVRADLIAVQRLLDYHGLHA